MATSKDYPEFSDICKTARDLERKLLSVQPSQISGSITHEGSYEIFPKEMEEFTYSYLLNEAHKVERKLFASSYSSQLSTPGTGKGMDERQVESELARFASEAPSAPAPEEKPKQGFAIPKMPDMGSIPLPFGKKQSQPASSPQASPPPLPRSASEAPKEIEIARDSEAAGENEMQIRPPAIPPRLQKQQAAPPSLPSDEEEKFETPLQEKEEADEPSEPKDAAPLPEEETAKFVERPSPPEGEGGREIPPAPAEEEKEAPARGALSSSKISPRLRAIIEEKLRKEEEKAAEEKGSADIEKPPEPEPENQREEDMPIMSARERLLRKLKRDKPQEESEPVRKEGGPEAEEEGSAPEENILGEGQEKDEAQPEEAESDERSEKEAEEEGAIPPRKMLPVSPKEEPEEKEDYARIERAERPPAKKAERQPPISPLRTAPSGGLVIKPVFSDEEASARQEKEEPPQDDERMQRIQRIISELSPDRAKSAALSKGAEEAKAKGKKKPQPAEEEPEEAEEAPSEEAEQASPSEPEEVPPAEEEEAPQQEEAPEEKPAPSPKPKSSSKKLPLKKGKPPAGKPKPQPLQAKAVPAPSKSSSKKPAAKAMPEKKAAPKPVQQAAQAKKAVPVQQISPAKKPAPGARETPAPSARAMPVQPARAAPAPPAPIARRAPAPTVSPSSRVLPQRTVPAASTGARPRILPGGLKQQPTPKTYVPPARQKLLPRIPQEETETQEQEEEAEEEKPRVPPTLPRLKKKKQEEEEQPEENERAAYSEEKEIPRKKAGEASPEGEIPEEKAEGPDEGGQEETDEEKPSPYRAFLGMRMKKQVSDEPVEGGKTQSELAEERRISEKSRQLQQLSLSKKQREISGQASLPEQEEEELEAPKPPKDDGPEIPKPSEYGEAKEEFRHRMEQEEVKEHARESSDALVEQYAKDNIVWLYEIYKMGGMGREDFLSKARDKMNEEQPSGAKEEEQAPDNPALSALGKELEKKKK